MSDQVKRVRSPNYPAISLREAVARLDALFARMHKHAAPKEAVVKALGYGGWNGASAMIVSAFVKYGFLERVGDDAFKITDRAMRVMFGQDAAEKAAALQEAAMAPSLYAELAAAFPGPVPHDDLLRPWLIRRGFAPAAVGGVIASYRETMSLAGLSQDPGSSQDPGQTGAVEEPMDSAADVPGAGSALKPPPSPPPATTREERIMDDDGNSIVVQFPFEPTLETYDFLKDYLDFRIKRLQRTAQVKVADGDD